MLRKVSTQEKFPQKVNTLWKGPVSVGVYLCQRWIVEFKGIMQPVLFMIFFSDFVTPKKRTMSEGCWLSTLEMTVQSLGNRDLTFR